MAKYTGTILTNKGKELLARAILGEVITITKAEIGKGIIPEETNKEDLTSLIETFKTLSITSTTVLEAGNYRVRVAFNNKGITEDTYLREIGIFARGEDGIEVLYSYCDTAAPDLIPRESSGALERVEDIITYISNASTINAVIDQSNVYATIKDLVDGLATKEDKFTKNDGFNKNKSDAVNSDDSNTLATSKAVKVAYDKAVECKYDVGDYWITESTSNPATKWTGTTWTKLEGRVLLGTSNGYALGTEGGRSTVALTLANMAAHTHGFYGTTNTTGNHYHKGGNHRHRVDNHAHTQPAHTHNVVTGRNDSNSYHRGGGNIGHIGNSGSYTYSGKISSAGGQNTGGSSPYTNYQNPNTSTTGNHSHTIFGTTGSSGSGSAFNIMNPYRVVNIWRRTA
ncbi:tail fiber protein [Fusobacteria bacterium ZRK30]|nr:tail fiber protein [Fusobacteria bacterium ZRK30]